MTAKAQGQVISVRLPGLEVRKDYGNHSELLSVPGGDTKTQGFAACLLSLCHQLLSLVHFKTIKKACRVPGEGPAQPILEMMKAFHQ